MCDQFYAGNRHNGAMAYSIDLSGRVGFVTGASGGLGTQFAPIMSEDLDALIVMLASVEFKENVLAALVCSRY